jgi:trk system potassium uptake protein TrkA
MRKQFVVIGLGRFGISVAVTLSKLGHDVMVIDDNESKIQDIMHEVTHAVQADAREEEILKALGVQDFEVAIVAIGDDLEASILITLMLKEMGIPCVVAKALSLQHGKVLEKIGADRIIYPEKDMGVRLAHSLTSSYVIDFIELSPEYSIFEVLATPSLINKTLGELNLKTTAGIDVIAIKRGDQFISTPKADILIREGDIVVVMGENKALAKFAQ